MEGVHKMDGMNPPEVSMESTKRVVTPEHRQAMTKGRQDASAVRNYLKALGSSPAGRSVSVDSLRNRMTKLEAKIEMTENPLQRLDLIQSRLDLEARISGASETEDMDALEREFVQVARTFSDRKGISWKAWRQMGVPAPVLRTAGIAQTK